MATSRSQSLLLKIVMDKHKSELFGLQQCAKSETHYSLLGVVMSVPFLHFKNVFGSYV